MTLARRRLLVLAPLAALAGCSDSVDVYRPPMQRVIQESAAPRPAFITMSDPRVADYIVRDVSPVTEAGAWRWTNKRPELRFALPWADGLKFRMEFSLPEATFAKTGPVTITFRLNGRDLGAERYSTAGPKVFIKQVPAGWLRTDAWTIASAEIDKVVVAGDGVQLGFILSGAGFVR